MPRPPRRPRFRGDAHEDRVFSDGFFCGGGARRSPLDEAEEEQGAADLGRLELVEAGEGGRFLQRALPVETFGQVARLGPQLRQLCGHVPGGRQHDVEAVEVAQHEAAIGDAAHRGQHEPLGRQLEVDGALGQHAVLELEAARGVRDDVREDALDLDPGGLATARAG